MNILDPIRRIRDTAPGGFAGLGGALTDAEAIRRGNALEAEVHAATAGARSLVVTDGRGRILGRGPEYFGLPLGALVVGALLLLVVTR